MGWRWPRESPRQCSSRVLEALWELLLQAILQALSANRDVSADFYGRFHFTLEVRSQGAPRAISPKSSPCCPRRTLTLWAGTPQLCWQLLSLQPKHPLSQLSGLRLLAFPRPPGGVQGTSNLRSGFALAPNTPCFLNPQVFSTWPVP